MPPPPSSGDDQVVHRVAGVGDAATGGTTAPTPDLGRYGSGAAAHSERGSGRSAAGSDTDDLTATGDHAMLARGALSSEPMRLSRVRHVFQGTTSALVYRYFLGKGDVARANPLVPLHRQGLPTAYVTEELKSIRMFALSTGGTGLSEKARIDYYNSVVRAEAVTAATAETVISQLEDELGTLSGDSSSGSGGSSSSTSDTRGTSAATEPSRRSKKESLRKRVRKAIADAKASAKNVKGPLTSAFPTAAAFVASLKGEQDRCLADMKWQVTQIVDGVSFDFFFRDVMDVAHDAFARAHKVQLRGKRHANADGPILRSNSLDSDVYLVQEADVLNIHANALHRGKPIKAFAMAVQFFSDATLLSWNGGGLVSPCAACVSVLGCWTHVVDVRWFYR